MIKFTKRYFLGQPFEEVLPAPFAAVDAAVEDAMPHNIKGISIHREQVTSGSVTYTIASSQLGELVQVKIRTLVGDGRTHLRIVEKQYPVHDASLLVLRVMSVFLSRLNIGIEAQAETPIKQSNGKTSNLQMGKPGRRRDRFYDEAFEMLKTGAPENDVFAWYCSQNGITKPSKYDRDAFKSAMKRRRNSTK